MFKLFAVSLSLILLSGCYHLTISNFKRSELSAVSGNKAGLITQEGVNNIAVESPILNEYLKNNEDLNESIETACQTNAQRVAPALIPIIASIGKLAFDLQMDKSTKELEKLKKAATGTFKQNVILTSNDFNKHTCAIIYRYDPKDNKIGFISVIKINKYDKAAFTIQPQYIIVHNTLAITKAPNEKEPAKINASIAVSIKGIGEKNGLPVLSSIGNGVITIPNIEVSKGGKNPCSEECGKSELIPYLPSSNKYISVTFSVVETGKLGVDLDEKIAEYKAIKEAIGPAIQDGIKEYYKK